MDGCGGLEQSSTLAQVSAVFVCLFQELETSLLAFSMTYCAVSHPYFCFSTCFNLDLPGELARFSLATSWKPTQKGDIQKTFSSETDFKVGLCKNQECCVLNLASKRSVVGSEVKGIRKCRGWLQLFPNYLCGKSLGLSGLGAVSHQMKGLKYTGLDSRSISYPRRPTTGHQKPSSTFPPKSSSVMTPQFSSVIMMVWLYQRRSLFSRDAC